MAQARSLVGLDVHAGKIAAAVLDSETGELSSFRLSGCPVEAASFCAKLPAPVRATHEAGPTGYGLARELHRREVECVVTLRRAEPRAWCSAAPRNPCRDRRSFGRRVREARSCPG